MEDFRPSWGEVFGWARDEGFPLVGATSAAPPEEAVEALRRWLEEGGQGFLERMRSTADLRREPSRWMPWARSALCVALPYNTLREPSRRWTARGRLWVSRYAWGRDYHKVVRGRLARVAARLRRRGVRARACVDSAPVLERSLALEAGLGAQGRNGLLLHPRWGSYLFLGEVFTDLEPPGGPRGAPASPCGECDLCVRACPTGALDGAGGLRADRCLSAWSVERGGKVPGTLPDMHGQLFGCDLCQEACPLNEGAPLTPETEFRPREPWFAPDPAVVLDLTPGRWLDLTEGMVLRRVPCAELLRTARRASGDGGVG